MKSSPTIWHYVVSVKSTVQISSIFMAFLENTNFILVMFKSVGYIPGFYRQAWADWR